MNEEMKVPRLSERLHEIATMVSQGNRVCDVGCDHGFVSIFLVARNISPYVIAMDVREGPLSMARDHVREYHVEKYIETRLSDGLENYRPEEAQSLIVAGMGGPLMLRILETYPEKTISFKELILQPQSEIPAFRERIRELGYEIVEEKMVFEEGKYYPMMRAIHSEQKKEPYTELELMYGPLLLQERNSVLHKFLLYEKKVIEKILNQVEKDASDHQDVLDKMTHRYELCEKALQLYR